MPARPICASASARSILGRGQPTSTAQIINIIGGLVTIVLLAGLNIRGLGESAKLNLVLAVTDDGSGIRSLRKKKTMGIHMMKYRADVCGGKLEIESPRGHGTTVTCRVPLES